MQTFLTYSIFTQNKSKNIIKLCYRSSILPKLFLFDNFDPLYCLTIHLKDSTIYLSNKDKLKLFAYILSKDCNQLQNTPQLKLLEKKYFYYCYKLKCLFPSNMTKLNNLRSLPSLLKTVITLLYFAYLLGKSKGKLQCFKLIPLTIRHSSLKSDSSVSIHYLVSTVLGLKPYSTRWLIRALIVTAQIFTDY